MPRLFVAVFPIQFKRDFVKIQEDLKGIVFGKPVEEKNFHITLSFIGNVEEKDVENIENNIEKVSKMFSPFKIRFSKIILIPSQSYVRVIGIKVEGSKIIELSEKIKENVGGDTKPPHLTLYRVKKVFDKTKLIEYSKKLIEKEMIVDSIKLMKSVLTKYGPIYSVVKSFDLNK